MPFVGGDLQIRALELLATALDHAIEAHIVLQRVGASDVVVVGIAKPHGNSRGLIDFSGDRLEGWVQLIGATH